MRARAVAVSLSVLGLALRAIPSGALDAPACTCMMGATAVSCKEVAETLHVASCELLAEQFQDDCGACTQCEGDVSCAYYEATFHAPSAAPSESPTASTNRTSAVSLPPTSSSPPLPAGFATAEPTKAWTPAPTEPAGAFPGAPTDAPSPAFGTAEPTKGWTPAPTEPAALFPGAPTDAPTDAPSPSFGTAEPTKGWTPAPTEAAGALPGAPTDAPSPSFGTAEPTDAPSPSFGTAEPTKGWTPAPTEPAGALPAAPTDAPSPSFGTGAPTKAPSPAFGTAEPTKAPSPSFGTAAPTKGWTAAPTEDAAASPGAPTDAPSPSLGTSAPTKAPSPSDDASAPPQSPTNAQSNASAAPLATAAPTDAPPAPAGGACVCSGGMSCAKRAAAHGKTCGAIAIAFEGHCGGCSDSCEGCPAPAAGTNATGGHGEEAPPEQHYVNGDSGATTATTAVHTLLFGVIVIALLVGGYCYFSQHKSGDGQPAYRPLSQEERDGLGDEEWLAGDAGAGGGGGRALGAMRIAQRVNMAEVEEDDDWGDDGWDLDDSAEEDVEGGGGAPAAGRHGRPDPRPSRMTSAAPGPAE